MAHDTARWHARISVWSAELAKTFWPCMFWPRSSRTMRSNPCTRYTVIILASHEPSMQKMSWGWVWANDSWPMSIIKKPGGRASLVVEVTKPVIILSEKSWCCFIAVSTLSCRPSIVARLWRNTWLLRISQIAHRIPQNRAKVGLFRPAFSRKSSLWNKTHSIKGRYRLTVVILDPIDIDHAQSLRGEDNENWTSKGHFFVASF